MVLLSLCEKTTGATESTHNKILYLVLELILVAESPQNNAFTTAKFGNYIRALCLK